MRKSRGFLKKQAEKILKPLWDKIQLMQTLQKVPDPLLRAGAGLADKGVAKINKILDNFGK